MEQTNVYRFPIASNVCQQVLREIEKQPKWSMAHVAMNPRASSLEHLHREMTEVYVITQGCGELEIGSLRRVVTAGNVIEIPPRTRHCLLNLGASRLEHLVFAFPPFDPGDVVLDAGPEDAVGGDGVGRWANPIAFPLTVECFDGSRIMEHPFPQLGVSIAFGWLPRQTRRRNLHYHSWTREWIYVVAGNGAIYESDLGQGIQAGDWLRIDSSDDHVLHNREPEDLVVVSICEPPFDPEDVHPVNAE